MSQFRTTADILTEVLQKAGEPINGNSQYQTIALTYVNKVHHAIIGGGSILNINVDEPWVWARSKYPIVMELQPSFTSASVTVGNGSTNIIFQQAPSQSLEGWHFQVMGKSTVYKIMNHTAAGTTAQLDSNFVDDSGVYSFRAMKLEYPIFPAFLYVDNYNDMLNFQEVTTTTAGSTTATRVTQLPHGSFIPSNFIQTVVAQLNSVGTAGYTGSYDTVANTFALSASACVFNLLGASGANTIRSAMPTLGLNVLDYTAAQSYSSTNIPNAISRMVEPFKLFTTLWNKENFIYSTDPVKMQEDYPVQLIGQRVPDRFAHIGEDSAGVNWVRFNCYPGTATKVSIDWVPVPIDLQNNTASVLRLPRADADAVIHGAAAWVLYDKNDSKWETTIKLCSGQLDAMKKKNHGKLLRTGESFGQIIPRSDLNRQVRRLNYGYTVNGGTAAQTTAFTTPEFMSASLTFASFQTAATVSAVAFTTLPANFTLLNVIVKHSIVFTGSSITGLRLNIGTAANPTQFVNAFDVAQPVASTASMGAVLNYFPAVATPIQAQLIAVGANLANLTAGVVQIYLNEAQL